MAGSSRSTPFPVPVYIYRSFYRSKIYRYQYRYRYRYSGFRGFSVLKLIWFNSRNNCSTSTERANKPWIGFLPALHYPSIYWWHYVMVSIIQPWTWDRGLLWLTLSFFIYITAKPVGYIYPKEISINTVKFLYQTIAHLDSSVCYLWDRLRWKSVMGNEFLTTI